MATSKKYDYRVVSDGTDWTVEIIRRVTSKKTVITKAENGFSSESEAQSWGEKEVKIFLNNLNLNEQKKRYSK